MSGAAVEIEGLSFSYGERAALDNVSFEVASGAVFGLLGPNGGGKTTLFHILSTLFPYQTGKVRVLGHDPLSERAAVRASIGVVFQNPSLDGKLTVRENLEHHGHLYGVRGQGLRERIEAALATVAIDDRGQDTVETLSGGLKRRVELAKAMVSRPKLLIMDEPSTGLDPGARRDLRNYIETLRSSTGATVLLTTHLMDEAERCDRLVILDRGRVVAEGSPDELRSNIGGEVVLIRSGDPDALATGIRSRFGLEPVRHDGALRLEQTDGHELVERLIEAFPDAIDATTVSKPALEDVFLRATGHRFWSEENDG